MIEKGYANINYPPSLKTIVIYCVKKWMDFCSQPETHKEQILFGHKGGYENKINGQSFDLKENFHITTGYVFPDWFLKSKQDEAFFTSALTLLREIQSHLFSFSNNY